MILEHKDAASFFNGAFRPALIKLVIEGKPIDYSSGAEVGVVILVVLRDTVRESFPSLSERKGSESRRHTLVSSKRGTPKGARR